MYILVFGRDDHTRRRYHDYTVLARGTLDEVSAARHLSGDLVFDESTGKIVRDPCWLFAWERQDPTCYAQSCIAADWSLSSTACAVVLTSHPA